MVAIQVTLAGFRNLGGDVTHAIETFSSMHMQSSSMKLIRCSDCYKIVLQNARTAQDLLIGV